MMTKKKNMRRWMLLIGVAAAAGGGVAYAQPAQCVDCYPCYCNPDGTYGTCCTWYNC